MGNVFSQIKQCCEKMFNRNDNDSEYENIENLYENIKISSIRKKDDILNENNKDKLMIKMNDIIEEEENNSHKNSDNCNDDNNELCSNINKEEKITSEKYESFQKKVFKHKITYKDFEVKILLGKGAFGKVLLVYNKELNKFFAMKILKKKFIKQYKQIEHTKNERKILEKIEHPFIAGLFFAFQNKEKLYMVTEYMPGGEMFYHLHNEGYFSEERAKFYIAEIVLAIDHLHKNNIIYRDLKPENILLDEDGHIKLTDFGLSKIVKDINKDRTFTVCGTPAYIAPEILLGKGYNKMVDWWSVGVLLYEMLCGNSPFIEAKFALDIELFYKPIVHDKLISDIAFDLILKLCNVDETERYGHNVESIKNHSFFSDIDWEKLGKKEIEPPFKPKIKSDGDFSNFDKTFTEMDPESYNDKKNIFNKLGSKKKNIIEIQNPIDESGASYDKFTYAKGFIK